MPKDDAVYINHIYDTARKISELLSGKNKGDFDSDEVLRIAVTHLLQIIGEAANRVSSEFEKSHPDIPLPAIAGMRHKIVHDYWDIDEDVVWETATNDIPELIKKLDKIITQK